MSDRKKVDLILKQEPILKIIQSGFPPLHHIFLIKYIEALIQSLKLQNTKILHQIHFFCHYGRIVIKIEPKISANRKHILLNLNSQTKKKTLTCRESNNSE